MANAACKEAKEPSKLQQLLHIYVLLSFLKLSLGEPFALQ